MKVVTLLILALVTSCATPIQPLIQLAPPTPPPEVVHKELTVSEHLEAGFKQYERGQLLEAAESFSSATRTGHLNNAGRALAYWQVADCHSQLGNVDEAAEAFFYFTIIAQDILEGKMQYAVTEDGNFTKRFDLQTRLDEAINYINILWKSRNAL